MRVPTWQKLLIAKIDAKPVGVWNKVVEYVPGSRLLRLQVIDKDESGTQVSLVWSPVTGKNAGADGIVSVPPRSGLLLTSALYGALIAKLGGSSADVPDGSLTPYGSKKVFAVGSFCIVTVGNADAGPLFLTMNDGPDGFETHTGSLLVQIDEFPM